MNTTLSQLLEIVRVIQNKYPLSHVGGSVGIFLHGIDLGHEWKDIDICIPSSSYIDLSNAKYQKQFWSACDFDYGFFVGDVPIEIKVDADQTFKKIFFQGFTYNVTDLHIICQYKLKYARKGHDKHYRDLEMIYGLAIYDPYFTISKT